MLIDKRFISSGCCISATEFYYNTKINQIRFSKYENDKSCLMSKVIRNINKHLLLPFLHRFDISKWMWNKSYNIVIYLDILVEKDINGKLSTQL